MEREFTSAQRATWIIVAFIIDSELSATLIFVINTYFLVEARRGNLYLVISSFCKIKRWFSELDSPVGMAVASIMPMAMLLTTTNEE